MKKSKKEKDSKIKSACNKIKEIIDKFLRNETIGQESICSMEYTAIIDNNPSIKFGGRPHPPKNKKLPILIKNIILLYEDLSETDFKNLAIAVNVLKLLNPNLKTGKKTLSVLNPNLAYNGDINKNNLIELLNLRNRAINIKEIKENQNKNTKTNPFIKNILDKYSSLRMSAKNLHSEYDKILGKINEVKKINPEATKELKPENFIKKDELSNFIPEIKKIKAEVNKINKESIYDFDIRSLESIEELPLKITTKILNLIREFLNGQNIDLENKLKSLNLSSSIKKANGKLDRIEKAKYNNNGNNDNSDIQKNAENYFSSLNKAPAKIQIALDSNVDSLEYDTIKQRINSGITTTSIDLTLKELENESKNKKIYHFALISEFTNKLNDAFNAVYKKFQETSLLCVKGLDFSKAPTSNILTKISTVTGAVATIGCFAGFAMSCICPIVGWVIFGVCCAAFVCNIANAVVKTVKNA